jgi:RNA polymerase sigma-70 factor (family 1)
MASYEELTDDELTILIKDGDRAAFAMIYQRYYRLLFIHANKKLGEEEEAKDMIQELFATLWLKRDKILTGTCFAAYLYTAVRNRVLDHYAHRTVNSKYIDSLQGFMNANERSADDYLQEKELLESIQREIAALPAKMREVFQLSRDQELSHKEISNKLGISEQTVSKQISNALKILRKNLGITAFVFFLFN